MVPFPRISLEGNIGSGKSTLLKFIDGNSTIQVVHEPVELWQSQTFGNMLNLFYSDPKRWSYTFQHLAFSSRIGLQRKYSNVIGPIIFDRSVMTDREVFARNLWEQGTMSEIEKEMYIHMHDLFTSSFPDEIRIDGYIYLKTPPGECRNRISRRDRDEEKTIPLEYLVQLDQKHEEWISSLRDKGAKILEIDGMSGYLDRFPEETLKRISDFVHSF